MLLIKDGPVLFVMQTYLCMCLEINIRDVFSDSGANLLQWRLLGEEFSIILNIVVMVMVSLCC